jgi:hypothetical protein
MTTQTARKHRTCPGCGLRMPESTKVTYDGNYNCSPECWVIYTEVLRSYAGEGTASAAMRQILVDTYAVQHAGGRHPEKSVAVHLAGLHAVFDRRMSVSDIPPFLQRIAAGVKEWPRFRPPILPAPMTIFDIAMAESEEDYVVRVTTWSEAVWNSWADYHRAVASFLERNGF